MGVFGTKHYDLKNDRHIRESFWYTPAPPRNSLSENLVTDIVIVGGGIAGLSAAYELGKKGYDVVMLEARTVGSGGTGNSAGVITGRGVEPELREYMKDHSDEEARSLWTYLGKASEYLRKAIEEEGIGCGLREGCISLFSDAGEACKEVESYRRIGIKEPTLVRGNGLREMIDSDSCEAVLLFDEDYSVNPLDLSRGLADAAEMIGRVTIYENSPVSRIDAKSASVSARENVVRAKNIVIATNPYTFYFRGDLPRTARRRGVSIHSHITEAKVVKSPRGKLPIYPYGFWDGEYENSYLYGRAFEDGIILVSSGNYKFTTVTKPPDPHAFTAENIEVLSERFPDYKFEAQRTWGGRIGETAASVQKMGKIGEGIYITSIGDGIPVAFLSGRLIAECIDRGACIPPEFDINKMSLQDYVLAAVPDSLTDITARFYAKISDLRENWSG
jgi:gamma-glutamylputrescine oxidase